ncbi:MAG TPA: ABC transporter substrate-binding protein [Kofleriaceae bacterium]|nr:ABC transporter substrate-binding protein [Kofleriaceae bacterium]
MRRGPAIGAVIAALAATAIAAPARAETRPRYGRALVGTLLGRPTTFDPVEARSHAEAQLVLLVYDSLYELTDDGELVPHLALGRPTVSADGLEARVRLRRGVLFQDGSALGPADVVASLERLRRSRAGWLLAPVASIAAVGDEIVLRLGRPAPELIELLAAPAAAITPGGRAPRRLPVGSGPFAMRRAPRATGLTLDAWDQHFAGRPYADRLELGWFTGQTEEAQAYEIGRLNLSFRGSVAFTGHQPKYPTEVSSGPAAILAYIGFGRAHGRAFDNRDLRQALSLALGRDSLRHIGSGERILPTIYPVAIDLGGREPRREDLLARTDAARAALNRATRSVAALSGRRPTLDLLVDRTRPDDREIGERVVGALFQLGLSARIVEVDAAVLVARAARGECDLYIGQLAPPGPAQASQMAAAFAAGGDGWAAAQLASGPLDVEAALAAFGERLPVVPLFHRAIRVHHRVDVRQVWFDATGRLLYASMHLFGGY